jgi:predicted  nucleic acid-binding Zn-ribbon protein
MTKNASQKQSDTRSAGGRALQFSFLIGVGALLGVLAALSVFEWIDWASVIGFSLSSYLTYTVLVWAILLFMLVAAVTGFAYYKWQDIRPQRIIDELQSEIDKERRRLQGLQEARDRLRGQLKELKVRLGDLQREKTQEGKRIESLRSEREQLEADVAHWRREEDNLQDRVRSLKAKRENHRRAITGLEQRAENLKDEIDRRGSKLEEIKAAEAKLPNLKARLDDLRYEKMVEEEKIDALRSERRRLKAQVASQEQQKESLQNRIQSLEDEEEGYRKTVAKLEQKIKILQDEIQQRKDKLKESKAAKAELKKAQTQLEGLQSEIEELEAERSQSKERLGKLNRQVEQVEEDLKRLQGSKHAPLWQAILRSDLDAGILTPDAKLILNRLGKNDPEAALELGLEIVARKAGRTNLPAKINPRTLTGCNRLFARVIQSREAREDGELTEAVRLLCDGWEAVLTDGELPSGSSPQDSSPRTPSEESSGEESIPSQEVSSEISTLDSTPSSVSVTGNWSSLTLEVNGRQVVIDPGNDYDVPSETPDLALVTHAHNDHVHSLLALCERYPDLPVVMSPETAELLDRSLSDWQVLKKQVYTTGDIKRRGIEISWHAAGHVRGARMSELHIEGLCILVTGDFCLRSVGGLPEAKVPGKHYDLVLMEAVHASDVNRFPSSSPQRNRREGLIRMVRQAAADGHTRMLIVADALGKAQEVYVALMNERKDGKSRLRDYTICLRGKAYDVASLYLGEAWEIKKCDDFPRKTILIASRDAADELCGRLRPAKGVLFEPERDEQLDFPSSRHYSYKVDLHASFDELAEFGQQVNCSVIGLYHSETRGSPLEERLRATGKEVFNVANADGKKIDWEDR